MTSRLLELLPALVAALVLLAIAHRASSAKPAPRKARITRRQDLRALAARGNSVETISRMSRTPHDVVTLTVQLQKHRRATAAALSARDLRPHATRSLTTSA